MPKWIAWGFALSVAIAAPHAAAASAMRTMKLVLPLVSMIAVASAASMPAEPTLEEVVARMSRYVAGYGEQASLIVAVEKYHQLVMVGSGMMRRRLTAEFVIVRTESGVGWVGFRDVNEVDGQSVTERRDRLQSLLIGQRVDAAAVTKISNESSRYNVGPTIRNFNVPTTTLFFFHPSTVGRFLFNRVGKTKVAGREIWEISFTETARPTLIMKRDATDVPCEGTLWVAVEDGTVVRTRLRLQHFADAKAVVETTARTAPAMEPPPANPPVTVVGSGANAVTVEPKPAPRVAAPPRVEARREEVELRSVADVEVTYDRVAQYELWLPSRMKEVYEGAMLPSRGAFPQSGRAVTEARYSQFKRFETTTRVNSK